MALAALQNQMTIVEIIGMNGRGCYRDNAWIERFWRTIKTEYVYLNPYDTPSDMRDGIAR